jgi:SAM-dependent methyltransferase
MILPETRGKNLNRSSKGLISNQAREWRMWARAAVTSPGIWLQRVGPQGKVYAAEIDDTALAIIEKEMKSRGVTNVVPIRAEPGDAKLPEPVDLVFSCDTYHHMEDRVAYFQSLARYLKPDGKVAILDFHAEGFFSGLLGHGTTKQEVRREMESAGYRLAADYDFIDRQHFQVFSRTDVARATALLPRRGQSYSVNVAR